MTLQEQFVIFGPLVALEPLLNKVKFCTHVKIWPVKFLQLAANGGQFKQVLFPELACPGGQFSRGTHVPFVAGPAVVAFAPA